jgi:hypothetical protein
MTLNSSECLWVNAACGMMRLDQVAADMGLDQNT